MVVEDFSSNEHSQAVRRVYEHEDLDNTTTSLSKVIRVVCHFDHVSGKNIVLWDDILASFKDVVHVRSGENILPFLKGRDFKNLEPLRIAAVPGVTLDVVVTGQLVLPEARLLQEIQTKTPAKEMSVESLQKELPGMSLEHGCASSITTTSSIIIQNPESGLVEEALENYTHTDNPATAPVCRGPQTTKNDRLPADDDDGDDPSKLQHSPSKAQRAQSPQEYTSGITRDFAGTLMKATLGDKDAQVAVGDMYRDGWGVTQSYQTAMDWYLKAAEQKDPIGQCKVGYLYDSGLGVTQNWSTSMEWFILAAEQGYPAAQYNIGVVYRYGREVPQDYSKAMEWFLKAAEEGHAAAQQNIGRLHQCGLGVPKDYARAMEWYRKAADQGNADAQCNIGYLYDRGLGVPQDDAHAMEWYRKAAEQGLADAQYNLGAFYSQGRGVPKDKVKAMEWYKKAANQGDENAMNKVNKLKRQSRIVQSKQQRSIVQADQQKGNVQTDNKKPGFFKRLFDW